MVDIGSVDKEIRESEALQLHYRLKTFELNHYVVRRNYEELLKFLTITQGPEAFGYLWIAGKKPKLDSAIAEVTRLFLNFLASVSARTDNTRRLVRKYYGSHPFFKQYQSEIDTRFLDVPIAEFVKELRNYSVHYSLPIAGATWKITASPEGDSIPDQAFLLHRDELLESSYEWKKGSVFLEEASEEIRIKDLVEEYFAVAQNFHDWMMNRLVTIHREDLEWLQEKGKIVQTTLDRIYRDISDQPQRN